MKPRIILIMIALVVIPTAILSLLAGGAVQIRERDLERRLIGSAEQAVESVVQSFKSHLRSVHGEVISEISGLLVEGQPDGILSFGERIRRSYRIVDRIYVLRLPEDFIYPLSPTVVGLQATSDGIADGSSNTNEAPMVARLRRVQALHQNGKAFEMAAREYQRILDSPGVSPGVRAEAGIGAARCYRELGKYDFAAGLLRQFAGYYSSGALALRRVTLDPRLAVRNADGHMYSLVALAELSDVFREASEREGDAAGSRWSRRATEAESELLERVVFLYDYIIPERRDALLAKLTEDQVEPGEKRKGGSQQKHLMALLRERQRNELLGIEEREALSSAIGQRIQKDGVLRETAWLSVSGSDYTCNLLPDVANTVCGIGISRAGMSQYLSNSVQQVGERQGVRIAIEDNGTSNIERPASNVQPKMDQESFLASGRLPVPFDAIALLAYPADPEALARGRALRVGLQRWGVIVLALGVIGGALAVLSKASGEVRRARARSDFVAGVSHDLRTPLSSMRMLAESLYLDRVKDPGKQKRFLNTILRESSRLGNLAEKVLFFVRLGDDALRYERKRTDICGLVGDAVEAFCGGMSAGERGVGADALGRPNISLELQDGVPEVEVDSSALTQVVMNLLDNAAKYSRDQGSGKNGIEVAVGRWGDHEVEISVRDHGRGMEQHEIKKVFRRFYRAAGGATDTTPGYGLGLALCMQIVRAHRGRIEVESEPGKGSRFRVILPV